MYMPSRFNTTHERWQIDTSKSHLYGKRQDRAKIENVTTNGMEFMYSHIEASQSCYYAFDRIRMSA